MKFQTFLSVFVRFCRSNVRNTSPGTLVIITDIVKLNNTPYSHNTTDSLVLVPIMVSVDWKRADITVVVYEALKLITLFSEVAAPYR